MPRTWTTVAHWLGGWGQTVHPRELRGYRNSVPVDPLVHRLTRDALEYLDLERDIVDQLLGNLRYLSSSSVAV